MTSQTKMCFSAQFTDVSRLVMLLTSAIVQFPAAPFCNWMFTLIQELKFGMASPE